MVGGSQNLTGFSSATCMAKQCPESHFNIRVKRPFVWTFLECGGLFANADLTPLCLAAGSAAVDFCGVRRVITALLFRQRLRRASAFLFVGARPP